MTKFKPGDFDYEKAWLKWAKPKFDCLPADIRKTYELIRDKYDFLNQQANLLVRWPTEEEDDHNDRLYWRFDNCPVELLLKAIPVIYAYGHWGSGWAIPNDGGAYWKFQSLAKQVLLEKNEKLGWDLNWDIPESVTKKFIVLSPEEIAVDEGLKDSGLCRHDIININFKPHPFVIGTKHIELCNGILSDPDVAPCAYRGCNLKYAEHVSDRVVVVAGLELDENGKPPQDQEVALSFLAPVLEKFGIDGFVFLKEEDMKDPFIFKVLDICTNHMEYTDSVTLQSCIEDLTAYELGEYGWLCYVGELEDNWNPDGWSEAFINVLKEAQKLGCDYVRWDRDGREYDELSTFDW